MFSENNKISVWQLRILLILYVFGVGIIVLPRRAVEFASQDGWIVIIAATAAATIFGLVITTLTRLFPYDSFISYTSKIIGRPMAFLLGSGLVVKILVGAAMELRFFGEIVKQTLLFNTPLFAVIASVISVGAYAASKGYETRARLGEILILIVIIPVILIFGYGAFKVDISNIMPVLESNAGDIIAGGFFCTIAFTGLELILLVNPYVNKPLIIRRTVITAIPIIGLLMLFITTVTICEFGPEDVKHQIWPVIEMMDVADLPGSFIERQTAFIMSFWIISVFAIVNAALFFSSVLLKDILSMVAKKAERPSYILFCAFIVLILSLLPSDIMQAAQILDSLFITFGIAYFLVFPLLLLLIAKVRRLGK